jgi:DeoR family fructose operon transcriptional repressor
MPQRLVDAWRSCTSQMDYRATIFPFLPVSENYWQKYAKSLALFHIFGYKDTQMGISGHGNGYGSEGRMYAEERHQEIVERAREAGRVEVAGLASLFDVSPETVRRDLSALEEMGVLRRTHGGAVPVERVRFEPGVTERMAAMLEEKRRIGEAALRYLPARGAISLDAGTTTGALATAMPLDLELAIVTNCLPIASMLATRPFLEVMVAGGRVRDRTLAAVGDLASSFLDNFVPDVAFLGTNGVSVGQGLTTPDAAEAAAKRAMIRNARRVVLLADHTKIGQEYFVRFAEIGKVDVLITDSGLDDEPAREIEAAGVEVVRA